MQALSQCTGRAQGAVAPAAGARPAVAARPAARAAFSTQKQTVAGAPAIARSLAARRVGRQQRRAAAGGVVARAGGDVLVVGSSGQTAARVVVNLLKAGFKVTAGVDTDLEESQEVVKFAKQVELINKGEAGNLKLAEFNPLDGDSIAGALRRGSRVVLVVGDQAGSRKPDLRIYDAVVAALLENAARISQLVLVTPAGGGGGGFFGGAGGGRLSGVERAVVESGVDYLIVRAAPSDRVTDRYGEQAATVVAPAGGLPSGLQASRSQVAAAVVEAMTQASGDAIIEVGASPKAAPVPLKAQVAAALAGAQVEAEEEEEEEAAPEPAKRGGFFTIGGGRKAAPAPVEEEEEEEEEEAPAPPARKPAFSFGGFGTRKISRQPVAQQAEEEEEEEEEAAPAPAPAKRGGFFTIGGGRKPAPAPAPVEEEEQEEEEAPAPAKRGAFAFGTRRQQAAVAVVEEEAEAPPATRRIVRGRAPVAAPKEETVARAAPAAPQAAGEKKKGKNPFGWLPGVSDEVRLLGCRVESVTVYADEA